MEFGINVDRSFQATRAGFEIDWKISKKWTLALGSELRVRRYTSTVAADLDYHNRRDFRVRFDAAMRAKLGTNWRLLIAASLLDNNSNREDPRFDVNEAGYQDITGAISFALTL